MKILRVKLIINKGKRSYRVTKQDFNKFLVRDAQRWTPIQELKQVLQDDMVLVRNMLKLRG